MEDVSGTDFVKQCNRCNKYLSVSKFDPNILRKHHIGNPGKLCTTCDDCRTHVRTYRIICSHGKRKERCRDCGGSEFCLHGRRKYRCRICEEESNKSDHNNVTSNDTENSNFNNLVREYNRIMATYISPAGQYASH